MAGQINSLSSIIVHNLRDTSGNQTDPISHSLVFDGSTAGNGRAVNYDSNIPGKQGIYEDSNTIKIRFNLPIISANPSDFAISGRTIYRVETDGSEIVTIELNPENTSTNTISIVTGNRMETILGSKVDPSVVNLIDKTPAYIDLNKHYLSTAGYTIEVPFSKELESEGVSLYRRDIEVIRLADGVVLGKDDYSTTLKYNDKSILVISISKRDISSKYSVQLKGEFNPEALSYIRDTDGNVSKPSIIYFTEYEISK